MADEDQDKKNLEDNKPQVDDNNQSEVDIVKQSEVVDDVNIDPNQNISENQLKSENLVNDEQNNTESFENKNETSENGENENKDHQVIHKKDGRLHIYVRQDKYKGELKSKNWVGRLYIDGKQKISSSGTQNLDEAIPILEKWYDDVIAESEKQKKQAEEQKNIEQSTDLKKETTNISPSPSLDQKNLQTSKETSSTAINENNELSAKNKVSNILGKLKNIKLKKPSLKGIKLPQSSSSKGVNAISKVVTYLKSKIGKSSIQGEEIIGLEITNKEIRLAQVNVNKSNQ